MLFHTLIALDTTHARAAVLRKELHKLVFFVIRYLDLSKGELLLACTNQLHQRCAGGPAGAHVHLRSRNVKPVQK